jgi:3-hydroxyisobutyrate dehydrogenase-like beta-hydroxyacid dehydrogenase
MAQRVTHFGATGNGQAAKVCNQVIVAVSDGDRRVAELAEAMSPIRCSSSRR